jgi:hypothetical protein
MSWGQSNEHLRWQKYKKSEHMCNEIMQLNCDIIFVRLCNRSLDVFSIFYYS